MDIQSCDEVAAAWERWCGITAWSSALREFGKVGGSIKWYGGYPRSRSAIPLCFTLICASGDEINGSRLKDIQHALTAPGGSGQLTGEQSMNTIGFIIEPLKQFGCMRVYQRPSFRADHLPHYVVYNIRTNRALEEFRHKRSALQWAKRHQNG